MDTAGAAAGHKVSRRLEQEIRHLYACFGGLEEEEAVAKVQKKAKMRLTKVHEGIKRARDHIGLHLCEVVKNSEIQRHIAVPRLELAHFCLHDGPPGESRPCAMQADAAIQQACRAWEADPGRLGSVCGKVFEVEDRLVWDKALAAGGDSWMKRTPEAASEFPPDLDPTDDKEEDSDSSVTDTEEVTLPPAPPMEEDDAGLEDDSRSAWTSPTAGAAVRSCAGKDAERPDTQRQDPHH